MPANTQPIFTGAPEVLWTTTTMIAANATKDLTSGTIYLAFTADATNGGYVQRIRFRTLGTNSTATVARVWINNGGPTGTAANNALFDEITLPLTNASQTAAQANYELPLNFGLPPTERIYITLGTVPGTDGWQAIVIGGKY